MITSPNFNRSLQVGPREGGGTENKKKNANRRPSKTCASGGARFFDPKGRKGSVRVAQIQCRRGHKSTPRSIKKRYHRQHQKQSWFKSEVGRIFAEFRRYHEGEKPSKPCKGCSKSDFGEMRCTRLTNTVWAWFKAQKMTQKRTQRP